MIFSSYEFIFVFIPVALFGFFFLARISHVYAISWLVFCSFFFYGWWDIRYVPLISGSMLFNYLLGTILGKNTNLNFQQKKYLLIAGIAANLLLLIFFKYTNFLIENIDQLFSTSIGFIYITLPLAISFFTFQQIAYLVDAYQGKTREYSLLHYSLFVTFFPQLIAGPIVHHKEMLPQFSLDINKKIRLQNIVKGTTIFVIGFFKKAVIADGIAPYSNKIFMIAQSDVPVPFFDAWSGALAYTFQLYFDFSGYADMAIGSALLFNIRLPINFNSPYKALNISDFWRRWHITLSRFLKDYIYVPLGGNRRGNTRRYTNMMATMIIGGIWHGAGWTFLFWGFLHGAYLTIDHSWNAIVSRSPTLLAARARPLYKSVAWLITINAVIVGWVYFRAESFSSANNILSGMAGLNGLELPQGIVSRIPVLQELVMALNIPTTVGTAAEFLLSYIWIGTCLLIALLLPNSHEFTRLRWINKENANSSRPIAPVFWRINRIWAVTIGVMAALSTLALTRAGDFLYFQF
mgnify:CR=1 FL=1